MTRAFKPEAMSRRRALALFAVAGASGLALPRILSAASAAEAPTIPPAFAQVDKPIPGERGTLHGSDSEDKPILDDTAPKRRRLRRRRVAERREYRRKLRRKPRELHPPASENKPK